MIGDMGGLFQVKGLNGRILLHRFIRGAVIGWNPWVMRFISATWGQGLGSTLRREVDPKTDPP